MVNGRVESDDIIGFRFLFFYLQWKNKLIGEDNEALGKVWSGKGRRPKKEP